MWIRRHAPLRKASESRLNESISTRINGEIRGPSRYNNRTAFVLRVNRRKTPCMVFKRLAKKGRRFNVVLLDPPTFSRSKTHGVFRAEKNYGELVRAALPLLKEGGVLFASTNAANFKPADFLSTIQSAIAAGGRAITQRHYVPQPPDFPITRAEPSYLRTSWFRVV